MPEYSFADKDRVKKLYVEQGLTHEEVAAETGIGLATIRRWSTQYKWLEEKKKREEDRANFERTMRDLRLSMMQQAAESKDPQDVFAVIKLERMALAWEKEQRQEDPAAAPEIDRPRIFLEDMEFVAETLREIDPEGLKVLGRNFETIVERFKGTHEKAT